ncbi:MAG: hypothetical protein IT235_07445 [Bacteroidia bacterium]|nr:hypothetical protein [Bacteroidia bacterium]
MTNASEIKKTAAQYIKEGIYSKGFQTLLQLETEQFVSVVINEKLVQKEEVADFFWRDFVLNESIFTELFNSKESLQLLNIYFSVYKKPNEVFLKKLSQRFPDTLISALRLNSVFLIPEFKAALLELDFENNTHRQNQNL